MDAAYTPHLRAAESSGNSCVIVEARTNRYGNLSDFTVVYMNDAAYRTTHVTGHATGASLLHLTGLEKESALFGLFACALETGTPGTVRTRLNLANASLSEALYDVTCTPCGPGLVITWGTGTTPEKKSRYTAEELFESWTNAFAVFELLTRADGQEDLRLLTANRAFAQLISHPYETLPGTLFTRTCSAAMDWLPFYIKTAKTGISEIHESYNYDLKKYLSAIQFCPAIGQVALLVLDRTHLWKAEQTRRSHDAELSALFASMASGFCIGKLIRNAHGEVIDALLEMVNPAYELLEGFPTATLQGKYLSELHSDMQDLENYRHVVATQGKITFVRYIPVTGTTLETVCFAHGDDAFVCVENDVSARVRAERELERSQAELAEKHQIILDSIDYASKIQRNLLPQDDVFRRIFTDYAVIWEPRDIVGGDIYWLKDFDGDAVLCVCDCTGHGTPGAFLTMLAVSAFEAIITPASYRDTAQVIWELEQRLVRVLNVHADDQSERISQLGTIHDGCDLAVLYIARDGGVTISSGNMHVFICNGREVKQVKGQKIFIGEGKLTCKDALETVWIPANPQQKFYIATDGFFDQIGDTVRRPFGYQTFRQILLEFHDEPLHSVLQRLWNALEIHRGMERQRDDIQVIAFQK